MALSDADKLSRLQRFYREAVAGPVEDGFGVLLDGRPAKTPGGARLVVPTLALAELLAEEWARQDEAIDFAAMPATRLAFTVIDRAIDAHGALAREVARYADADALCYPAAAPRGLVERQDRLWTPWREWAGRRLDQRFEPAAGALHHRQPAETVAGVQRHAEALSSFALSGLVFAAGLYSSAILALAVEQGALSAVEAFELSRLEEAWQTEQWGLDVEAAVRTQRLRDEAAMLGRWFEALQA